MANTKISALTAATTPVAGTEVLPIVQSSTTKQVSIANLTAGRSVSAADYVMSTGNLVPSTVAKGVNFTANTAAAGMTSQLLNWYEEGTWTPTIIGTTTSGVGVYTTQTGKYTRIGRAVNFYCIVVWTAHTGTGDMQIGTLPFTSANDGAFTPAAGRGDPVTISASNIQTFSVLPNNTLIRPYMTPVGGAASSLTPITVSGAFVVSGTYYIS